MTDYLLFDPPHEGTTHLYRSSAGSGKTFTLTKAYLKLVLLDPSRYHQILAITFTNKAKDEMKSRIIKELSALARDEDSEMRQQILNDFKNEKVERIENVISSRAQLVLSSLLHDYSRFSVSTIDHFFTQLIRHLAKELDLNLGYELDVDNKKALRESIELLFNQADKKVLSWLQSFALDQIDNDKGWDIRKNIAELGQKLFQESYLDIEPVLVKNIAALESFITSQKTQVKLFENKIISAAKKAISIADQFNLTANDFKAGMPYNNFVSLASASYDFSKPPSATFLNALSLETWHRKGEKRIDDINRAHESGMGEAHQNVVSSYTGEAYGRYLEAKAILQYIYSYGVLAALAKQVQNYRSDQNLIFISDSAFILNKAITTSETPFIYEKIGAKYKYILIDEFQDTSAYQWKSLLPFFSNAISDGGQLLIVGDVKQSIYGWRGGDMNLLLHQVEKDISVREEDIHTLNTNFRSAKNIIRFNNIFFKLAARVLPKTLELAQYSAEFELAYTDVMQKIRKEYDGLVEVKFFEDDTTAKWMELAEQETQRTIINALQDGFNLNDILILTRKTSESTRIANFLIQKGIAAISEVALKVTSSSKVQLIISALKYMADTKNKLAIAEFNLFYQKIFKTSRVELQTPSKILISTQTLKSRPLYETIEELIIHFNLNQSPDIYLQHLLDLTMSQIKKGNTSLASFIVWWNEQEEVGSQELSLAPPENEGAVLVLTIHKAKGLEKPVVILPYADYSLKPKSEIFWASPMPEAYKAWGSLPLLFKQNLIETRFDEAYSKYYFETSLEALNLLYVAFTRAGERLYIFANGAKIKNTASALISNVLTNPNFTYTENLKDAAMFFKFGEAVKKMGDKKVPSTETTEIKLATSRMATKLVVDQKQNKLFMAIHSEKSAKISEGIVLHLILSMLNTIDQLPTILSKLSNEKLIAGSQKAEYQVKIEHLFKEIPLMNKWFSGEYEVLNERKIFIEKKTYIPDRVMIKNNEAIVVDYKREKKSDKHQRQIRNYQHLLLNMGYEKVEMYLLYIDELALLQIQ